MKTGLFTVVLVAALLAGACHPVVTPGTPSKDDPGRTQKK